MGRKRPSPIEGLLVIASRIPWWAGLLVALVSFLYLRSVALQEVQSSGSALENMGPAMISQIYISLARIFQYVLPLIFCIGAGISFFKASKRKGLLASACANGSSESIHNMSWHDFELLVGQIFRERGYQVIDNDSKGADGGVDLVLRKDNETFLVQCKHWKAYKVSVQIVRELYGVMASRGAASGFVVTSGIFTKEAKTFAEGTNIELIDGKALSKLINQHAGHLFITERTEPLETASPSCPVCKNRMIKRTARKGANAGRSFWGCANFPRCKGTRDVH